MYCTFCRTVRWNDVFFYMYVDWTSRTKSEGKKTNQQIESAVEKNELGKQSLN